MTLPAVLAFVIGRFSFHLSNPAAILCLVGAEWSAGVGL